MKRKDTSLKAGTFQRNELFKNVCKKNTVMHYAYIQKGRGRLLF
jgi:hypothetical protein